MTREEAISLLTQVKELILGSESWLDSVHQPIEEAFSMAIEAIRSTQSNASNVLNALDTIYRQAVIDAVHKNYDTILDFKSDGRTVADSFEDIINTLPSAQPEIIHCKNCEHNESSSEAGNANCNKFYGMTDQMGFCHYGERRTDE